MSNLSDHVSPDQLTSYLLGKLPLNKYLVVETLVSLRSLYRSQRGGVAE